MCLAAVLGFLLITANSHREESEGKKEAEIWGMAGKMANEKRSEKWERQEIGKTDTRLTASFNNLAKPAPERDDGVVVASYANHLHLTPYK